MGGQKKEIKCARVGFVKAVKEERAEVCVSFVNSR